MSCLDRIALKVSQFGFYYFLIVGLEGMWVLGVPGIHLVALIWGSLGVDNVWTYQIFVFHSSLVKILTATTHMMPWYFLTRYFDISLGIRRWISAKLRNSSSYTCMIIRWFIHSLIHFRLWLLIRRNFRCPCYAEWRLLWGFFIIKILAFWQSIRKLLLLRLVSVDDWAQGNLYRFGCPWVLYPFNHIWIHLVLV